MKFSEFISNVRKEKGLTQEQLGFELNYSQGVINSLEKEKRIPKIDEVEIMADRLGYEVVYVKKGEGISKSPVKTEKKTFMEKLNEDLKKI